MTALLEEMNQFIVTYGVKFGVREEYAIEYLEEILTQFVSLTGFDPQTKVRGRGHRKSAEQKLYDQLVEYTEKLKKYAEHSHICLYSLQIYLRFLP